MQRKLSALLAGAGAATCLLVTAGPTLGAPTGTQSVGMRVLLVTESTSASSYQAWAAMLTQDNIPYTTHNTATDAAITASTLQTSATAGNYDAVVFADSVTPTTMQATEISALDTYESTFGVREVDAYIYPSATYGLNAPTNAGSMTALNAANASLTTAGATVLPYLKGPVNYEATDYGYLSTPISTTNYSTLVQAPGGASLVGVYTTPDNRQELVSTVTVAPWSQAGKLLLQGEAAWVTGGTHLGFWRNNLGVQVDDIFNEDDAWNIATNTTDTTGLLTPAIRMVPSDVTRLVAWEKANNFRLDMVFNGDAYNQYVSDTGSDPMGNALISNRASFGWLNHTFTHLDFDLQTDPNTGLYTAPYAWTMKAAIVSDIQQNIQFANQHRLPIVATELVQGEYSGLGMGSGSCNLTTLTFVTTSPGFSCLSSGPTAAAPYGIGNPNLAGALTQAGIRYTAADYSRQPIPFHVGSAITVPRFPVNIYYNASTVAEQLSEYNYLYTTPAGGGSCVNTATTTCNAAALTWAQYVAIVSSQILGKVITNNPQSFYVHQSNIANDGILYQVLNSVLAQYKTWFNVPLTQNTLLQTSTELSYRSAWNAALTAGTAAATQTATTVTLANNGSTALEMPVSGTTVGTAYGDNGTRLSGWTLVPAHGSLTVPIK